MSLVCGSGRMWSQSVQVVDSLSAELVDFNILVCFTNISNIQFISMIPFSTLIKL